MFKTKTMTVEIEINPTDFHSLANDAHNFLASIKAPSNSPEFGFDFVNLTPLLGSGGSNCVVRVCVVDIFFL